MLLPEIANGKRPKSWDYVQYLNGVVKRGRWAPLPRCWCLALGIRAAAVISHVLAVGKAQADAKGWVPCTTKFLRDGLGLDADAQERTLGWLQAKGIAEICHRGQRQLRHVRVNLERLEQVVGDALAEGTA